MVLGSFRWFRMVFGWLRVVADSFGWLRVFSDGCGWFAVLVVTDSLYVGRNFWCLIVTSIKLM